MCKVKTVPVHAMKAYKGSTGIAPLIRNLDTEWRWVAKFKPRPLYFQDRTIEPNE